MWYKTQIQVTLDLFHCQTNATVVLDDVGANIIVMMLFLSALLVFSAVASTQGVNSEAGYLTTSVLADSQPVSDVILDAAETDRCTTIIVGPKAGKEGAMTTHTADCLNCDFRVGKVGACLCRITLISASY